MATVELTSENFDEVTSGNDMVLIDFWAAWCGPCRWFAPVFERAAERHGDIVFGKVDTEAQQELAGAFGIMSIPTLMVIRDNIVLYAQPGALLEAALEDLTGPASTARIAWDTAGSSNSGASSGGTSTSDTQAGGPAGSTSRTSMRVAVLVGLRPRGHATSSPTGRPARSSAVALASAPSTSEPSLSR